jgi:multidrug resistance efflux pump
MEILLLGIYSFFVWLIFIKLKWLPWNTVSQVTVVIIPIVGIAILILTLNVVAPSSPDLRVFKKVVQIVPQVRGRVIELQAADNRPMKKGDILFRIDPTPYQQTVAQLEAQLATAQGGERELRESLKGASAKVIETRSGIARAEAGIEQANATIEAANAAIAQATSRVREMSAKLELARLRVTQNRELASTGAGPKFDLERAETDLQEITAQFEAARGNEAQARASLAQARGALAQARGQLAQARAGESQAMAGEQQVRQKLGARVNGELAQVATIRAQLANAQWELEQTTVRAPADGTVVNLQLRPGSMAVSLPLSPVMSFVEDVNDVYALYMQNELAKVEPGNEAEIALPTYPGRIIKASVDSILWAIGQGQLQVSGQVPMVGAQSLPPGRFPVKLTLAEKDRDVFLAAGAAGDAAIYTNSAQFLHIIRKVIIRVGSYTNYLVLKLH